MGLVITRVPRKPKRLNAAERAVAARWESKSEERTQQIREKIQRRINELYGLQKELFD
ncbi:hypothetical protein ES702_04089 [subsurface metagenome]